MQLTAEQKQTVARWIAEGAKLSDVQQRLAEELGLRLTYMEARLLVDDLKLVPLDPVQPKPAEPAADALPAAPAETPGTGKVRLSVDRLKKPGTLVSGQVTFSDGISANWYLDQAGRFGLVPPTPDYRPTADDLAEFKIALETELMKQGM